MKRCPHLLDDETAARSPFGCFHGSDGRNLRGHAAAHPPSASFCHRLNGLNWNHGNARPPSRPGWLSAVRSSGDAPMAWPSRRLVDAWAWGDGSRGHGSSACSTSAWPGCLLRLAVVARRSFPPAVAGHLVQLACERPEKLGRSRSPWDSRELAQPLEREGLVASISPATVRRRLSPHQLKPWGPHLWLSPNTPRDTEFSARVADIVALDTRHVHDDAGVRCVEEKTSWQPRPRLHPPRPANAGFPHRVEHEYRRAGALTLLAAFDTRTGQGSGQGSARKRPRAFLACLAHLDAEMPVTLKTMPLVCDHARAQHGQEVRHGLTAQPRFVLHFTPGHGSWLKQVEPWCSIRHRTRLRIVDVASTADLEATLMPFIAAGTTGAHPFHWTTTSGANVMADVTPAAA
jgi:hypothetical protein